MAAQTDVRVNITAKDDATKVIKNVGGGFRNLGTRLRNLRGDITQAGLLFAGLTASMGLLAKSVVNIGAELEQNRIAFDTMTGSAEDAQKLMQELSDFAVKTPFDMPGVIKAGKQLLAMGGSTQDVIPDLKMLGDVAAGLGVPLDRLILNFGQVRLQQKLTGRELRDFSIMGVPLVDALVESFNKAGGTLTTVGATSTKTKEKMNRLTISLEKQNNRLTEMKDKGKEGTASFKNLNISIDENKRKLEALGPVSAGFQKRIKVTKEDIAEMVSDGEIGFDRVADAFKGMSSEGGKFADLMDKQAQSFSGMMSNLRDELIRFAAEIVGVSTSGEIREGSIFAVLKDGAKLLLEVISELRPKVQGFMDMLIKNKAVVGALGGALLGILIAPLVIMIVIMGKALLIVAAVIAAFAALGGLVAWLGSLWADNFLGIQDHVKALGQVFKNEWALIQATVKVVTSWLTGTALPEIKRFFEDMAIFVKNGFSEMSTNIHGFIEDSKSSFEEWRSNMISTLELWKLGMQEKLKPWREDFEKQFDTTFTNVALTMIDFNVETLKLWKDLFLNWLIKTGEGLVSLGEAFLVWLDKTNKNFKKWFIKYAGEFQLWLESLPKIVTDGLINVGVQIQLWLEEVRANFKKKWEQVSEDTTKWLNELPGRVEEGLSNVGASIQLWLETQWLNFTTWFKNIGKDAPDNLLEGFQQTEPSMREKIVTMMVAFIALVAFTLLIGFAEMMRRAVTAAHNAFVEAFNEIIPKIKEKIREFIESIKTLVSDFKPKISIGLDLPNVEEAWEGLKQRAKNIGIPGFQRFQTGGIVPGPVGAPVPILAHGGERVTSQGLAQDGGGQGGQGITFNVTVGMYAGSETEKRNIARDLYAALVQVSQSQNKTVQEFMGG